MRKEGHFYYWICNFGQFYEEKKKNCALKNFKILDHLIIIFRQNLLILDTHSILSKQTKVEFLIYIVC